MPDLVTLPEASVSNQNWETPGDFMAGLVHRFGSVGFDLAASEANRKAHCFFSEADDALAQDWRNLRDDSGSLVHVAFCNPPFKHLEPWAKKCAECRDLARWTLLLVPASMGSLWWARYVLGKAQADGIPRLKFVGAPTVYPKDLAVCAFGYGVAGAGYWDWRKP